MKTLKNSQIIIALLSLLLFGCTKDPLQEPTFENKPEPRKVTRVSVNTFGWMKNYRLKYIRLGTWVDTLISQQNYSVNYQCYTNELQHPVSIKSVEMYDKDTLRLSVTINTAINQQVIANKTAIQCLLQPNQAL